MRFKAVGFDVDGTLYPNSIMYLHSIPFALRHGALLRAFSKVRKQLRTVRPIHDFYEAQARLLGEELGVGTDEAGMMVRKHFYEDWEKVLHRVPLYRGVKELLFRLKDARIPIAVMSDFPVRRKLEVLGLAGIWDVELTSEESHYLKPNIEPFQKISEGLGVHAEDILYVGNSYEYDVVGAKRAGMAAAHLSKKPPADSAADFTFSRYRQLSEYLFE